MTTYTSKQIGVSSHNSNKEEAYAYEAFYPGHLLEYDANGYFKKHATAGGSIVAPMVAKEDSLQGNGVDTACTAANQAPAWMCQTGDIFNFRVKDGETIAIGDEVESAGDGTIQKYVADTFSGAEAVTAYPLNILGVAMSACDMSDSSAADPSPPFCAVRIR
jgi:hypothetical protein